MPKKSKEISFMDFLEARGFCEVQTVESLQKVYETEYCVALKIANSNAVLMSFASVLKLFVRSGLLIAKNNTLDWQMQDVEGIEHLNSAEYRCTMCNTKKSNLGTLRSHMAGKKHQRQILTRALLAKKSQLIADKNGVTVTCDDYDAPGGHIKIDMKPKQSINCTIHVTNAGDSAAVTFTRCELLHNLPPGIISFIDHYGITNKMANAKCDILPACTGYTYDIVMVVKTNSAGSYNVPLVFTFLNAQRQRFHIIRYITIKCSRDDLPNLEPTSPFTKPTPKKRQRGTMETIDGRPLPKTGNADKLERVCPMDNFPLPKNFRRGWVEKPNMTPGDKLKLQNNLALLDSPLTMDNYSSKFHALLFLEEIQQEIDMQTYDMDEAKLTRYRQNKQLLALNVPGLVENRPSVLKGDHLFLLKLAANGVAEKKQYKAYVHDVNQNDLSLGVHDRLMGEFAEHMKFEVHFTVNRFPLRMQHRAVQLACELSLETVLFPTASTVATRGTIQSLDAIKHFYNKQLEDNVEQARAVRHIVSGTARPAPYIIFGPPGTGKTSTVVEAIKQILKHSPNAHVLACAPSNSATDLLAQRLLTHVPKNTMLRLNAASRSYGGIPENIRDVCNYDKMAGSFYYPAKMDMTKYRVVLCTLTTAGRLVSASFPPGHFSHVVVDEAGHAAEPECIIPIAGIIEPDVHFADGGNVILAGDPQQLGPIIRSAHARRGNLGLSLLERLMCHCEVYARRGDGSTKPPTDGADVIEHYDSRALTKLVNNYRSHPSILCVPNELFYSNELQCCADSLMRESLCRWEHLPMKGFPLIFHSVTGQDKREASSPSFFNPDEIAVVVDYVEKLLETRGTPVKAAEIGIIAPYRKQVEKLQQVVRKKKDWTDIKVGSVEEFQGQERRVIIITTVRSNSEFLDLDINYKLGFVANYKRFNVAITRAKALLIVVGNAKILRRDKNWRRLINYCDKYGGCTGDYVSGQDTSDGDDIDETDSDDGSSSCDTIIERLNDLDLVEDVEGETGVTTEDTTPRVDYI